MAQLQQKLMGVVAKKGRGRNNSLQICPGLLVPKLGNYGLAYQDSTLTWRVLLHVSDHCCLVWSVQEASVCACS